MLLYVNGCSITHGYGVEYNNSYPNILAKEMGWNIINDSQCGVGNDWILHTTLERLNGMEIKPDLVIIQWSGVNRRLHCDIMGNYYYVNLSDHTQYHPKFEPMASEHTIHYMFILQEYLKSIGVKYLFFNYMEINKEVKSLSTYDKIDFQNFIEFDQCDLFSGMLNHMKKKGLVCDDFGHPNTKGHIYIFEKIIKKLKDIETFIKKDYNYIYRQINKII